MPTVELKLSLSDALAQDAEAQGLLAPEALERLLREELRRRRVDQLFLVADRLAALNGPSMTEPEIDAEIETARAERRGGDARRS